MSVSYIPEPYERPYYEALFRAADVSGKGSLSGGEAVKFFARSKLPVEVLKNIWTVADQPSTSSLDLKKFAIAVRLIQLTQNGQKGQGPTLAVADGVPVRPVFFEGVSGVSVPIPQPPGQQQQPPPPNPAQQRPPVQHMQQQQMQQAPLSPAASQRQSVGSAPPTPMQQGMMPPMTPGGNQALVTQDPYTMTPQERSRYEDLFPQYAKPDGFVYGKEAVELFMKSGLDQTVLRDIWNMVDRPVDNRLDKLEFAMAMHLIVCITKKNLPSPRGNLPNSLKALKAASSAPPSAQPRAPKPEPTPPQQGQSGVIPSPPGPQGMMPPQGHPGGMGIGPPPSTSFDHGPPPIVSTSGMSISDAFEGLSMTSDVHTSPKQATSALPSYVPEHSNGFGGHARAPAPVPEEYVSAPPAAPTPTMESPGPASMSSGPPPSSKALAANYDMGDSNEELGKLKAVLQKLQAENISLKAQLGSMSDEEKYVQKELSAAVAEIGSLSNELHTLRSQVLQAKTRLLEASSELKSAHERKGVISDLIKEATETKEAIDDATDAMQNVNATPHHTERKAAEAMQMSTNFESNLFDFHGNAPLPAPTPAPQHLNSGAAHDMYGNQPPPQPSTAMPGMPAVETASSDEEEAADNGNANENENDDDDSDAPELFSNEYGRPAPEPAPAPAPMPQPQYSAPPTPQYQQPSIYSQQPPSAHPTPQMGRPTALSRHTPKQSSVGFNSEFLMGGSAEPLPDETGTGISPAARSKSSSADFGYDDEESFQKVEELKRKAESAAEAARDAEAAHRRLMNEADELRADADKAEATSRSLKAAANEKKKGRFGRSGGDKKKILREADRAAEDAQDIRKRFLQVSGQATDASAVAIQTRREADKLRDAAEKAELEMAASASMREQQKKEESDRQQQTKMSSAPGSNGYPAQGQYGYGQPPQSYGQPPTTGGYGAPMPAYGQPPTAYQGYVQPPQPPGYGNPPGPHYGQMAPPAMDNGFASGVMGGGSDRGFDLPSPQALGPSAGGEYSNPFGQ